MKPALPDKTQAALEHLLRMASEEKVTVAGFAFCKEPICILNFGNCPDADDIQLFRMLCAVVDGQKQKGQAITQFIGRVQ
jgi:hypothetical protein